MACKDKCLRLANVVFSNHALGGEKGCISRYQLGYKRCKACQMFITCEGFRCPCCGKPLSTRPRARKGREMLDKIQQRKYY